MAAEVIIVKRSGLRKVQALLASPVAGAASALYNITPNRSAIIRKIMLQNACGADSILSIGQGLAGAFVAALPGIQTFNGLGGSYREDELPGVEFYYTLALPSITFQSTVAGINVLIEVEEIG